VNEDDLVRRERRMGMVGRRCESLLIPFSPSGGRRWELVEGIVALAEKSTSIHVQSVGQQL